MTACRIILLRHGQTDYNLQSRVQGGVDIPLNERGMRQAAAAARELARYLAGLPVGELVSSPLVRAHETARILSEALGVAVETDERLSERRFGLWEGMTFAEMEERWPAEYGEWRRGRTPSGIGIEPLRDLTARVQAALQERAEALPDGRALVAVGHGSATVQGIMGLLGIDSGQARPLRGLENCHWSDLERAEHWRLRAHNVMRAADPAVFTWR